MTYFEYTEFIKANEGHGHKAKVKPVQEEELTMQDWERQSELFIATHTYDTAIGDFVHFNGFSDKEYEDIEDEIEIEN